MNPAVPVQHFPDLHSIDSLRFIITYIMQIVKWITDAAVGIKQETNLSLNPVIILLSDVELFRLHLLSLVLTEIMSFPS